MNHFNKLAINIMNKLNHINLKNLSKIIYKPHRIIPYMNFLYTNYYENKNDIKLKKLSDTQILNIYKNSITAIKTIIKLYSKNDLLVNVIEDTPNYNKNENNLLKDLFIYYGSDKATIHNYHIIYYDILKDKLNKKINILEIGIGTNNINILSNMGKNGKPGASLRAFRDFLPNANVYGADIDRKILFTEERINTFYIDQTDIDILNLVKSELINIKFDLIIDDGLHNTEANLNSILFSLDLLSSKGIIIIEDIDENDLVYYQIIAAFLNDICKMKFIKAKEGCLFIIEKN